MSLLERGRTFIIPGRKMIEDKRKVTKKLSNFLFFLMFEIILALILNGSIEYNGGVNTYLYSSIPVIAVLFYTLFFINPDLFDVLYRTSEGRSPSRPLQVFIYIPALVLILSGAVWANCMLIEDMLSTKYVNVEGTIQRMFISKGKIWSWVLVFNAKSEGKVLSFMVPECLYSKVAVGDRVDFNVRVGYLGHYFYSRLHPIKCD